MNPCAGFQRALAADAWKPLTKSKTQSRDCDPVSARAEVSAALERSATFIVICRLPLTNASETSWKSAAGSFVVGGVGVGARIEYDERASPLGSVVSARRTGRAIGPIVPPPSLGPAICVTTIGLAT